MKPSRASRLLGLLGPDRSVTERVAIFAAVAVVGPTFEPGLQPRRTVHQAIATGLISTGTLLGVTLAESSIEAAGRLVARRLGNGQTATGVATRVSFAIAANSVAALAGRGIARALPPREGESLRRGLVRTVAGRAGRTAEMTTIASVLVGAGQYAERRWPRIGWVNHTPVAIPLGTAIATWHIQRVRRRMRGYGNVSLEGVSALPSVGLAIAVSTAVWGLRLAERTVALGVTHAVRRVSPGLTPVAWPIGHVVSLAGFTTVVFIGYQYAIRAVEQGGSAIEPAYQDAPTSPSVSGSPVSLVTYDSLSREGRRFANMVLDRAEITQVMGEEAIDDPIRVFIGLAAAPTVADRVTLAIDELERTGAFDRSVLCIASPTGSGYINYVFSEALEYLTRGDCATVTLQYSLRPSSLSLDRAETGIEQNTALLHAVTGYVRGLPEHRRPRIMLFGESLGAQTLLDTYRNRSVVAWDRDHIDAALFLGTPAATRFARAWRADPERIDPAGHLIEVDSFAEFSARALPTTRYVLLTHYDDPIPVFTPSLLVRRPGWLADPPETRPPGVPRATRWRPGTTFLLTGVDLLNAMEVVPGRFTRRGHDYREDIPDFVRALFAPSVTDDQIDRVQVRLREREMHWAQKRVVAEQLARAREAIERELQTWSNAGSVSSA